MSSKPDQDPIGEVLHRLASSYFNQGVAGHADPFSVDSPIAEARKALDTAYIEAGWLSPRAQKLKCLYRNHMTGEAWLERFEKALPDTAISMQRESILRYAKRAAGVGDE